MEIQRHVIVAFALRTCLLLYGSYQDENYEVKYTDIDYHVYTDASRLFNDGLSPFERHTYRYSPLLAILLSPTILFISFGKILFSFLDVLTGYLIYKILKSYLVDDKSCKLCTYMWLYNPVAAVVSTRGSSDSLLTVVIMTSIWLLQKYRIGVAAIFYGVAVHFRIYPCIYSISFYSVLSNYPNRNLGFYEKLHHILCFNKTKMKFVFFTLVSFIVPTVFCYYVYNWIYIKESFLYHFMRKDIKHNFSPYFYFNYLQESSDEFQFAIFSLLPFVFQFLLLLVTCVVFCQGKMLPLCLFIQTFVFVTFNKVCTSQYFLWYLCLFPLIVPLLSLNFFSLIKIACLWFSGQIVWLILAYLLEFQGANIFLALWCSSLFMFLENIYLLYWLCSSISLQGYDSVSKCQKGH